MLLQYPGRFDLSRANLRFESSYWNSREQRPTVFFAQLTRCKVALSDSGFRARCFHVGLRPKTPGLSAFGPEWMAFRAGLRSEAAFVWYVGDHFWQRHALLA
jgi:hypothetical protein